MTLPHTIDLPKLPWILHVGFINRRYFIRGDRRDAFTRAITDFPANNIPEVSFPSFDELEQWTRAVMKNLEWYDMTLTSVTAAADEAFARARVALHYDCLAASGEEVSEAMRTWTLEDIAEAVK